MSMRGWVVGTFSQSCLFSEYCECVEWWFNAGLNSARCSGHLNLSSCFFWYLNPSFWGINHKTESCSLLNLSASGSSCPLSHQRKALSVVALGFALKQHVNRKDQKTCRGSQEAVALGSWQNKKKIFVCSLTFVFEPRLSKKNTDLFWILPPLGVSDYASQ